MAVVALTTVDTPDISKPGKGTEFGRVEDVQVVVDGLLEGRLGGQKGKKVKRVIALTHIGKLMRTEVESEERQRERRAESVWVWFRSRLRGGHSTRSEH